LKIADFILQIENFKNVLCLCFVDRKSQCTNDVKVL
jgi:hypothetical protein